MWPLVYYLYIESCVEQLVNNTHSNGNSFGLGFFILDFKNPVQGSIAGKSTFVPVSVKKA